MPKKRSTLDASIAELEKLAGNSSDNLVTYRQEPSALNKNYIYSNEILTAAWLPRRLSKKDQTMFDRSFGGLTFITTSGHNRDKTPIGLPSGSVARKLFISLIDKAYRTQSPIVDFQSVYGLLKEVGLTIQTNNRRKVHDQFKRLATCRIEIYWTPGKSAPGKHLRFQGSMFDFAEMYEVYDKDQLLLIPNKVIFTERFFKQVVQRGGFGYLTELLRKTNSPLEIDILLWLVRRVAFTQDGVDIPIPRLKEQFATSNISNYDFVRWITGPLENVCRLVGIDQVVWDEDFLCLPSLTPEQRKSAFRYNPILDYKGQ
jgi:hypothetical protein